VNVLNKLLLYGLLIVGVALLFVETERVSTMIMAFGSFFFSVFLAWLLKTKGIEDKYLLYINIGLWFNMIGEMFAYYSGFMYYDKALHFALGVLITSIVFSYYKNNSNLKKDAVFYTVLGTLALWEIYEYLVDSFFGFQSQGVFSNGIIMQSVIDDTMQDLIWGSIGSWSYLLSKKEKLGEAIKLEAKKIRKIREVHFSKVIKEILGFAI